MAADPATREAMAQLAHRLHETAPVMRELATAMVAQMPQFWGLEDLCRRYSLGRDSMRDVLIARNMLTPERGKPIRIHVDDVLTLDQHFRSQRHH